jgi:hypothetical protein
MEDFTLSHRVVPANIARFFGVCGDSLLTVSALRRSGFSLHV